MTRASTAVALVAVLCLATQAVAQDGPQNFLDRMFGRSDRPSSPDATGQIPQSEADQVQTIERLEAQIRQLTGQVEQLQHRNRQLEAQLRQIDGSPPAQPGMPPRASGSSGYPQATPAVPPRVSGPVASPQAPQALPPPGRRSDVFDPSQNPNAPGVPRPLGSIPGQQTPEVVMADPNVGIPGGRQAGAPLDLSTLSTAPGPRGAADAGQPQGQPYESGVLPPPPSRNLSATGAVASVAPPSDSPKDYYDLAYGYMLRKDFALAEESFEGFLTKYPKDRRVADARYWLGESLYQRQRYDAAASAFLDLSTKHGSHPKAPDALLRLGQSLAALQQKEMACATLAEIGRKYPRASNTVKQGVEREQKRVRC